jgi:hypothetical protein
MHGDVMAAIARVGGIAGCRTSKESCTDAPTTSRKTREAGRTWTPW